MSEKNIQAIVLDSFDFQDFDKIVTVYSNLYGKLSFISLGVNKSVSKNKYSINYLSLSEFEIFKSRNKFNLSKLKKGTLINSHLNITKDYNLYLYANLITSLVNTLDNNVKNFKLFNMLKTSIDIINTNPSQAFKITVLFMFYFLNFIGYKLDLSNCGFCNLKDNIVGINFNNYCMVCRYCYYNDSIFINNDLASYLRFVSTNSFNQSIERKVGENYLMILAKFLLNYYKDQVGIFTNSMYELNKYKEFDDFVFTNQILASQF
ncbi:DNA repair protein RecO [Vibrio harveyi]|nr:DNA repair protein RecO [Vibrio harveyi]